MLLLSYLLHIECQINKFHFDQNYFVLHHVVFYLKRFVLKAEIDNKMQKKAQLEFYNLDIMIIWVVEINTKKLFDYPLVVVKE